MLEMEILLSTVVHFTREEFIHQAEYVLSLEPGQWLLQQFCQQEAEEKERKNPISMRIIAIGALGWISNLRFESYCQEWEFDLCFNHWSIGILLSAAVSSLEPECLLAMVTASATMRLTLDNTLEQILLVHDPYEAKVRDRGRTCRVSLSLVVALCLLRAI